MSVEPDSDPPNKDAPVPSKPDRQEPAIDLAHQRAVMLGVIDRAAPLFKALAKK